MKKSKQKKQREKGAVSIKTKIIALVIPVIAVMIIVMISLSYKMSSRIIYKDASELLESSISYQSTNIASWLNENLSAFSIVKQTVEQTKPSDADLQKILDATCGYNSNYPNGMYVADINGNVMKAAASEATYSDVKNATWYQEGLSRINMHYGTAYQSADGVNQVSASAIINDGSDHIRVISGDVSLERITIIVNSFVKMNQAEAFLVDSRDRTILAHRNSKLVSTKLDTKSSDKFMSGVAEHFSKREYEEVEIAGNLTTFQTVPGTDWILVSYIPTEIIYANVNTLRTRMIGIAVLALLLLIVMIERCVHIMLKPVRELTSTITTMTDGDFTVDVDIKSRDEIGKMGRSVEQFIHSIRGMLHGIQNISEQVSTQSGTTNDRSVDMNDVAKTQAEAMGELNHTVDQLSESITEIAENATTLALVVADTKDTSTKVQEYMD